MNGFFHSGKFKVLAVVALILIGLMIRTAVSGGLASFTADALSVIVSPVQKLSSNVSGFFDGLAGNVVNFSTLKSENQKLKKQISDYQSKLVNYDEILRENQQLEAVNDIKKENPDFKLKPASVISREAEQWYSSFTIDRGSLDGVAMHDPVITSDNDLVGEVMHVYAHTAVVATVLDPSVYIGVIVSDTGDTGQAHGDLSLYKKDTFKVMYISKDSAVSQGDIVVTTGTSGVFPKNLKVGTVTSVGTEENGASLSAVCKPMASPSNVKSVYVLTNFSGKLAESSSNPSGGSK